MPVAMQIVSFLFTVMEKLPTFIAAGKDITDMLARTKAQATQMAQENRGPTQAEWDTQTQELNAIDASIQSAHPELKTPKSGA